MTVWLRTDKILKYLSTQEIPQAGIGKEFESSASKQLCASGLAIRQVRRRNKCKAWFTDTRICKAIAVSEDYVNIVYCCG
jgi:hypothetical protein